MTTCKKTFGVAAAITLSLSLCATLSAPLLAQIQGQYVGERSAPSTPTPMLAKGGPDPFSVSSSTAKAKAANPGTSLLPDAPLSQGQMPPVSQYPTGINASDGWRVGLMIYGWFPGMHGNVGARGYTAGVHVPFSDLFDALKGVVPVAVEADKNRFVMPIDFLWMKVGADKATPIEDYGQDYVTTFINQTIFTPKVGYRLVDADHMKFDVLGGIRYWHVNVNNTLQPSGLNADNTVNWVDGLGGARMILPFGEKAAMTIGGDAGAGESTLDYQIVGLLNYNINPRFGLAVGWRYLYDDFRPTTNEFVYNPTLSGAVAGFNFNFGGKPPIPPTASCSVSPTEVFEGDPVTITASPQGLNPKLSVVYVWTGNGVTGNGPTATIATSGLQPSTYAVRGEVREGKPGKEGEKPWQVASCSAAFTVKHFDPPTISCSANPADLKPGDSTTITAQGMSPQNRPLTYTYKTSSGTLNSNGSTATYSSAGAPTGTTQIICTVSDDKGQLASAIATVNIQAPPPEPPPALVARLTLHSVFFPTAQPTAKHPEGGLVESQQAILTALATDFKTYLQEKPDARITLTGHADPRGTPEFNQALSERRVARAKAFLVEQGVPEASIDTQAVGEDRQLNEAEVKDMIQSNPDLTDDQRTKILSNIKVITLAQNRRVDIRLNGTDEKSSRHYPFNAADSSTLLDLQKPVHKHSTRKR